MNQNDSDVVSCYVDPGGSGYDVSANRHACCKYSPVQEGIEAKKRER